jgi:hypothetical protein
VGMATDGEAPNPLETTPFKTSKASKALPVRSAACWLAAPGAKPLGSGGSAQRSKLITSGGACTHLDQHASPAVGPSMLNQGARNHPTATLPVHQCKQYATYDISRLNFGRVSSIHRPMWLVMA